MNINSISFCNRQNFQGTLTNEKGDKKINANEIKEISQSDYIVSIDDGHSLLFTTASLSEVLSAYNTAKSSDINIRLKK